MRSSIRLINYILHHPVGSRRKLKSLYRVLQYQLYKRFNSAPFQFRFTKKSKLFLDKEMTGATGNYYCGLHEFEDMSFLLHFLRPGDLFIDIGANIGSYTVLASAEIGCESIAVEPIPNTFTRLLKNLSLNNIVDKVTVFNIGLGSTKGKLNFTADLDTGNHVVNKETYFNTVEVEITTLDELMKNKFPTLIKIDVEGYEWQVLEGAIKTIQSQALEALIIEHTESATGDKNANGSLEDYMKFHGFSACGYDPWSRNLTPGKSSTSNNTLFIKRQDRVAEKLKSAKTFEVFGIQI